VGHKIFQAFEATLANTAAMEAITAQSESAANGRSHAPAPPVSSGTVEQFVHEVQAGALREERATPALNVNDIRTSKSGYGASTLFKASPAQPSAPPKPVSTSVTSF
jgi:hypothetical protein